LSTKYLTKGPEETAAFARGLAEKGAFKKGSVIRLHGDIGCGKTTFVRGFVSFWDPDELVTSPTFTIINEYGGDKVRVVHADLYRLSSPDEVRDTGLEDQIAAGDYSFIEWPERLGSPGAGAAINIRFSMGEKENERWIEIES
jgi:tRNA threonylcarbamoyladenosine biosynthesis protein TsaE